MNNERVDQPLRTAGDEPDVTQEELALFKAESLRAIARVKPRLRRERQVRRALQWSPVAVAILLALFFLPRLAGGPASPALEKQAETVIALAPEPEPTPGLERPGVMRGDTSELPALVFPVNTSVPPGEVVLKWEYTGAAEQIELTVQDMDCEDLLRVELDGGATNYEWVVEPDRSYYWKVEAPGKAGVFEAFSVLAESDWRQVQEELRGIGMAGDDLLAEIAALSDGDALRSLHEVFTQYQLHREAAAAGMRLAAVRTEEK